MFIACPSDQSRQLADRVEKFVREVVTTYEQDSRNGPHGPSADLVKELRTLARSAGLMTPHILPGGEHLTQGETAAILERTGLSPLGPVAVNTMAPTIAAIAEPELRFITPDRRNREACKPVPE